METKTETEKMSVEVKGWSETEIRRAVTTLGENLGTFEPKGKLDNFRQ